MNIQLILSKISKVNIFVYQRIAVKTNRKIESLLNVVKMLKIMYHRVCMLHTYVRNLVIIVRYIVNGTAKTKMLSSFFFLSIRRERL